MMKSLESLATSVEHLAKRVDHLTRDHHILKWAIAIVVILGVASFSR